MNIIVFGAHPDDCEYVAAGVAAQWAAQGHRVKFVSCTNGDIGHYATAGGPLAQRRRAEVEKCAEILGIRSEVLDNHDGELEPTLENRKKICRLIREWKADIVIGHRPNDYHPDHRYTGILVQDAAYMVTVPFFCPETPHLTSNPVFLYSEDHFLKPTPFSPDIVVGIDDVIEKKMACFLDALVSQVFEGGCNATAETSKDAAARKKKVRDDLDAHFSGRADKFRAQLREAYGEKKGHAFKYAEAFEICEYGRRPDKDEIRKLFPFFA